MLYVPKNEVIHEGTQLGIHLFRKWERERVAAFAVQSLLVQIALGLKRRTDSIS